MKPGPAPPTHLDGPSVLLCGPTSPSLPLNKRHLSSTVPATCTGPVLLSPSNTVAPTSFPARFSASTTTHTPLCLHHEVTGLLRPKVSPGPWILATTQTSLAVFGSSSFFSCVCHISSCYFQSSCSSYSAVHTPSTDK